MVKDDGTGDDHRYCGGPYIHDDGGGHDGELSAGCAGEYCSHHHHGLFYEKTTAAAAAASAAAAALSGVRIDVTLVEEHVVEATVVSLLLLFLSSLLLLDLPLLL